MHRVMTSEAVYQVFGDIGRGYGLCVRLRFGVIDQCFKLSGRGFVRPVRAVLYGLSPFTLASVCLTANCISTATRPLISIASTVGLDTAQKIAAGRSTVLSRIPPGLQTGTVRSGGPQSELDWLLRRAFLDTYGTQ